MTPWTVGPGSSVHGILQAKILEWVAIPFSRGSSQHRDRTQVSCIASRCFTICASREASKEETKEEEAAIPAHSITKQSEYLAEEMKETESGVTLSIVKLFFVIWSSLLLLFSH